MRGLLLLFVCFFAFEASAERWIIKNPKQSVNLNSLRNLNHHSEVTIENHYVILDFSKDNYSRSKLIEIFNAESAFKDVQIEIDKPVQTTSRLLPKGWHTEALEYDNLNSEHTGKGVIVAVLDTGVDYRHEALETKMWKNVKEIPDNEIDDDGNGLVDDYHGYNFNENTSDPTDVGSHGTHCAGIIAANKDEESNARGVAQDVQIMPLLIISSDYLGFLSGAAHAVKYATDNGAKVLSNSWRIYHSWNDYMNVEALEMLKESIKYAGENDVIFVAAAGNESKNLDITNLENAIYPLSFGGLDNMVGVASTIAGVDQEKLSTFSNYGVNSIAIAAPGSDIYSTVPYGRWSYMSGTSMATPIIAGTLARGLSKGYGTKEAINELNQTSVKNPYWQQYISHGRVDIKKYLE